MSASARSHTARLDELCEGRLSPGDVREIALMAFDLLGRTPPEYLNVENPDPGTLAADFDATAERLAVLLQRVEDEATFEQEHGTGVEMQATRDYLTQSCDAFDQGHSIVRSR